MISACPFYGRSTFLSSKRACRDLGNTHRGVKTVLRRDYRWIVHETKLCIIRHPQTVFLAIIVFVAKRIKPFMLF